MRPRNDSPVGYVNLFYLIPAFRGSGLGDSLHAYAVATFAELGINRLTLSVSPLNARALASWCSPCRAVAPEVRKAAADLRGRAIVLKVDADASPLLVSRYGVQSIPNLMIFSGWATGFLPARLCAQRRDACVGGGFSLLAHSPPLIYLGEQHANVLGFCHA